MAIGAMYACLRTYVWMALTASIRFAGSSCVSAADASFSYAEEQADDVGRAAAEGGVGIQFRNNAVTLGFEHDGSDAGLQPKFHMPRAAQSRRAAAEAEGSGHLINS